MNALLPRSRTSAAVLVGPLTVRSVSSRSQERDARDELPETADPGAITQWHHTQIDSSLTCSICRLGPRLRRQREALNDLHELAVRSAARVPKLGSLMLVREPAQAQ